MRKSVRIIQGDCLEAMARLPDNSVDSIVTDPPYELTSGKKGGTGAASLNLEHPAGRSRVTTGNGSGGFMGQAWDSTGVAFDPATWRAALRVLKPGGHLVAFGGTRTYHRLTCAIEDAGFEIRDSLHWIYGCLTADTEILTEHGWKPGIEVARGERVAQWDAETGRVSLAPVEQTFRAPWDGPMRVLRNADTDQILTPNHRVYHQPRQRKMTDGDRRTWYDGRWQVAEAATLSTWNPVRLPIAGEHDGPGIGGGDYAALLGWVWTEGGFDLSGSGVRVYQSSVNAAKVAEIAALMDRLGPHKRYDRERTYTRRSGEPHTYTETTWFMTGSLAARVRADLPGKRPTYGLLWRMTSPEKRAMLRAAMLGDGSGLGTSAEQFYQQHEDDLIWLQTLLALIGRAGKVTMRGNRPGGSVALRQRATTELQARHLRHVSENYLGEVWCVQVPTGAFLARRNGRVFITGNSGFPKSLNVSKAIDKAAGATRAVIGVSPDSHARTASSWQADDGAPHGMVGHGEGERLITAPATADATRWSGWGTALKPSFEPVVVARKPAGDRAILVEIGSHLSRLEREWSSLARDAAASSPPTHPGSPEARTDSAPGSAATQREAGPAKPTPTGAGAGSSAPMATFPSESTAATFLSTVTSWIQCWAELCELTSTSTTGTTSSTTTGLRILSSSLSRLTAASMAASPSPESGLSSFAGAADALFGAAVLNSRAILALSAAESATGSTPPTSPGEDAPPSPAHEPIVLARKPLISTVAGNVLEHGTGALNIDASRVGTTKNTPASPRRAPQGPAYSDLGNDPATGSGWDKNTGRWPPNILLTHDPACVPAGTRQVRGSHDQGKTIRQRGQSSWYTTGEQDDAGTDYSDQHCMETMDAFDCADGCPVAELDAQSGSVASSGTYAKGSRHVGAKSGAASIPLDGLTAPQYGDTGGASRFFPVFRYQAKAPKSERPKLDGVASHPTVKPLALMRWLVTLVTPPGGLVLDLFAGTGTTGQACQLEGFRCILIERDGDYVKLIRERIK